MQSQTFRLGRSQSHQAFLKKCDKQTIMPKFANYDTTLYELAEEVIAQKSIDKSRDKINAIDTNSTTQTYMLKSKRIAALKTIRVNPLVY
eukprot:403343216